MTENNPAVVDPVTEIVTTSAVATIAVLATTVVAVTQYILRRAAKTKHVHCGSNTRVPSHSAGCHELYLNSEQAARCMDAAGSISLGTSILRIDALAADAECALLLKEAEAAVEIRSRVRACAGAFSHRQPRFRMPVVNFLVSKSPGHTLCDAILRRALVRILEAVPGLVAQQLGEAAESSFHNIIGNRALQFSEGEPAVNVYYAGGEFSPHEDKQRLTVLLALKSARTKRPTKLRHLRLAHRRTGKQASLRYPREGLACYVQSVGKTIHPPARSAAMSVGKRSAPSLV